MTASIWAKDDHLPCVVITSLRVSPNTRTPTFQAAKTNEDRTSIYNRVKYIHTRTALKHIETLFVVCSLCLQSMLYLESRVCLVNYVCTVGNNWTGIDVPCGMVCQYAWHILQYRQVWMILVTRIWNTVI